MKDPELDVRSGLSIKILVRLESRGNNLLSIFVCYNDGDNIVQRQLQTSISHDNKILLGPSGWKDTLDILGLLLGCEFNPVPPDFKELTEGVVKQAQAFIYKKTLKERLNL